MWSLSWWQTCLWPGWRILPRFTILEWMHLGTSWSLMVEPPGGLQGQRISGQFSSPVWHRGPYIWTCSTDWIPSFRLALKRFVALRGHCQHYYSDRGSNFVCADNQNSLVDIGEVVEQLNVRGSEWHFNTPCASHQGCAWERKIGAVRRVLEGNLFCLGVRLLSAEEFSTLLLEAMTVVNNTHLWGVSADPSDPVPLTFSMILTLRDNPDPPHLHEFNPKDVMAYGPRRWRKVQYVSECFWQQWTQHYIASLSTRRKWSSKTRNVSIKDVVLLREKDSKRNVWPTGVVKSVKMKEGIGKSVSVEVVKTKDGVVTKHTYERPISSIVLLIQS